MKLPKYNADGLAPIELTDEQKYLFDTQGWLLVPGVLSGAEIEEMRAFSYRLRDDRESISAAHRSSIGGPLARLTDHPIVVGFMNEFVADSYLASEKGYGFRMENSFLALRKKGDTNWGPHGGSGLTATGQNSHIYQVRPGSVYAGLSRAVWELNPVKKGEGGTKLVSGSHKASFELPASATNNPDSPLWEEYECPAGSVLFFTEALTHTGALWTNPDVDRVAIFNCYNTIGWRWHNWEPNPHWLEEMPPLRQSLFRSVCCERNRVE